MKELKIIYKTLNALKPYDENPRHNEQAVDAVANSIENFGFKVPIVIDKDDVIVCGHTRYLASQQLGLNEVPCVIADDLTDEQIKAYRLVDNKVAELSEWDFSLLDKELAELGDFDMEQFGFIFEELENLEEEQEIYSQKTNIPQYEIQGEQPDLSELVDEEKTNQLIQEIENSRLPFKEKEFLKKASKRHLVFNYRKIAEYYANASKEMQELMEKSALVIIDYNDAIANGYTELSQKIKNLVEAEKNAE